MKTVIMKTNKRCKVCGRIITVGEQAFVDCYIKERFYPIKGIMKFPTYHFTHANCEGRGGYSK
jgi:hypothetical protein